MTARGDNWFDVRPKIAISACLLGRPVRYDGGHKTQSQTVRRLSAWVEWLPLCPEMESGLGVPRPAMSLRQSSGRVQLKESVSGRDHTVRLDHYSQRRAGELAAQGVSGYLLKSRSPSCGLAVQLADSKEKTPGLFAAAVRKQFQFHPVIDEQALLDLNQQTFFLIRVFAHARLQQLLRRSGPADLKAFIELYTPLLESFGPSVGRQLLALADPLDGAALCELFGAALAEQPSSNFYDRCLGVALGQEVMLFPDELDAP